MTPMPPIKDAQLREILSTSATIAVLGVHSEPEKAAYYVPEYLHDEGYRIIGVNPVFAGQELFGEKVGPTLAGMADPIDLVDVFCPAGAHPRSRRGLPRDEPAPQGGVVPARDPER